MRIGLYLWEYKPNMGGSFTFQESLLGALRSIESDHEIFCFYYGEEKPSSEGPLRWVRLAQSMSTPPAPPARLLNDAVIKHRIELVWFVTVPIYETVDVPYLFTVWDLEHRMQPYFPEVSVSGWTWDMREQFYQYILPRAAYVIVGTEAGKKEVVDFYRIPTQRVKVVPFAVPGFVSRADTHDAPDGFLPKSPYLFYPAQFWPHKNHVALLLALKILVEQERMDFSIVFTGSDKGNRQYVQQVVNDLGLKDRVHFRGFVSRDELIYLYRNAFALAFPSFFGPDNIPPLEAFGLGCPVVAARVSGAGEQMGDAALLFDPQDEAQLAAAIKRLHATPGLRETLIQRGRERAKKWTASDYVRGIFDIAEEFKAIRRCWSNQEPFKHL
jgi:glycosyltransferase involved in cell wall biosynthesis